MGVFTCIFLIILMCGLYGFIAEICKSNHSGCMWDPLVFPGLLYVVYRVLLPLLLGSNTPSFGCFIVIAWVFGLASYLSGSYVGWSALNKEWHVHALTQ